MWATIQSDRRHPSDDSTALELVVRDGQTDGSAVVRPLVFSSNHSSRTSAPVPRKRTDRLASVSCPSRWRHCRQDPRVAPLSPPVGSGVDSCSVKLVNRLTAVPEYDRVYLYQENRTCRASSRRLVREWEREAAEEPNSSEMPQAQPVGPIVSLMLRPVSPTNQEIDKSIPVLMMQILCGTIVY